MSDEMTDVTDRQRDAVRIANTQIPGWNSPGSDSPGSNSMEPDTRDIVDLSGAALEKPTQEELERITADVIMQLKTVYDPEIPVDIYELGLIYKVDLDDDRSLKVDMTLTAPGCPVAGEMPLWVQEACEVVAGLRRVEVNMTFDPPWTMDMMSEEARLELNML
ncbi:MAG: SUF system Fe-S cluster assembly protein [Hyphomonadaceae bacterium]|nr:SUF system Fe-S cluster assembly protein [Hyphomonadaceae bacterium]